MKTENLVINFLGDSITEGCGTSSSEKVFHALLKEELGLKNARNYGVSGTRISRQDGGDINFIEDFCQRAEKMEDADVIVVFGGTNDFGHGTSPMGEFSDRTNYSFYGALHCLSQSRCKLQWMIWVGFAVRMAGKHWNRQEPGLQEDIVQRTMK